jgi:hypothetical protein
MYKLKNTCYITKINKSNVCLNINHMNNYWTQANFKIYLFCLTCKSNEIQFQYSDIINVTIYSIIKDFSLLFIHAKDIKNIIYCF